MHSDVALENSIANLWKGVVEEISMLPEENLTGMAHMLGLQNDLEFVDRLANLNPKWAVARLVPQVDKSLLEKVVDYHEITPIQRNNLVIAAAHVLELADERNQVSFVKRSS
jgi:hypothetical protein